MRGGRAEISIFETNAEALRQLHAELDRANELRRRSPGDTTSALHAEAARRFRDEYDLLAFPGGLEKQLQQLRRQDPAAVEMGVRFLEADPLFFRSGYIKADLIRHLKRGPLSSSQQERLRRVVVSRVLGPDRREFRSYARLAGTLATPGFLKEIRELASNGDADIARRAGWILEAISTSPEPAA